MNRIKNKSIILFMFLLFLINVVSANVNLTFQSDNEKVINFINIDNGYIPLNSNYSNSTNETINLTYNNYVIKLYPQNTKMFYNNGSFIFNNLNKFNNDRYLVIWIAVIFALIILFFKYVVSFL